MEPEQGGVVSLTGETILVVDDEHFFRRVIADPLRLTGYKVLEVADAAEVPGLLGRHQVTAVLTDLEMPGISGLELLGQLRNLDPDLPVAVISAHSDFFLAQEALRAGAFDYLLKPFTDKELLASVNRLVEAGRMRKAAHINQAEAERRLIDLVLLRELAETASGTADLQSLFDKIIEAVLSAVQVQTASLMLPDDDGFLTIRAEQGMLPGLAEQVRVAPGKGVSGHVFVSGEPVLIADIEQDERFVPAGVEGQYSTRSALSLPLKGREGILGVLNVNNKLSGDVFSAADRNLLASVTHQASLAIENFHLVSQLQEKARQLELMNRVRSRMVCNLSHELRTPLTSVLGFADLLVQSRAEIDTSDQDIYLGQILESSTQMEQLINGMLLLFSIDSEQAKWRLDSLDLQSIIAGGLDELRSRINEARLDVAVNLPEVLPAIAGDKEKFPVALWSLLDNAVKFNRADGRVEIAGERHGQSVRLRIYNQGRTVASENAEAIFAPYNQLGEINIDKPSGVGIGLSLCRTIIEHAGGRIDLDPVDGEGTAFILELPLWDPSIHAKGCDDEQ